MTSTSLCDDGSLQRDLIIYVPGYTGGQPRGASLNSLLRPSLQQMAEVAEVEPTAGCAGFAARLPDGREVDFFEIYWESDVRFFGDIPNPWNRLQRGVSLVYYWSRLPILRAAAEAKFMVVPLISGMVLLMLWLILLTYSLFEKSPIFESVQHSSAAQYLVTAYKPILTKFPWLTVEHLHDAFIVLLAAATLFNPMINLSDLFKRYLAADLDEQGQQLPAALNHFTVSAIRALIGSKQYNQVTVLGHSFGAVLAVDAIASKRLSDLGRMRLITLGGFFYVLQLRSDKFCSIINDCLSRRAFELTSWIEFWSPKDWLSCSTRVPHEIEHLIDQRPVMRSLPIHAIFDLKTHARYFLDSDVLSVLLKS